MSGYSSVDDTSIIQETKIVKKRKVIKKLIVAKFCTGAGYQRDFTKFQSGTGYQRDSSKFYLGASYQRNFNSAAVRSLPELSEKAQSGHGCCVSGSGTRAY